MNCAEPHLAPLVSCICAVRWSVNSRSWFTALTLSHARQGTSVGREPSLTVARSHGYWVGRPDRRPVHLRAQRPRGDQRIPHDVGDTSGHLWLPTHQSFGSRQINEIGAGLANGTVVASDAGSQAPG